MTDTEESRKVFSILNDKSGKKGEKMGFIKRVTLIVLLLSGFAVWGCTGLGPHTERLCRGFLFLS